MLAEATAHLDSLLHTLSLLSLCCPSRLTQAGFFSHLRRQPLHQLALGLCSLPGRGCLCRRAHLLALAVHIVVVVVVVSVPPHR